MANGTATSKHQAARAIGQQDLRFLQEVDIVNGTDLKGLSALIASELKKGSKLRVFISARIERKKPHS
jgi:hypothetical protein